MERKTKKPLTPLQESLPVIITSWVNKTGTLGVSLLPILLVERGYGSATSAAILTAVKATTIFGTLLSGWAGDVLGLRITVLGAFLCSAIGFTFVPIFHVPWQLAAAGMIGQLGVASTNGSIRLLLTRTVRRENQKEGLGWMRTANNFGQIVSYTLLALAATIGLRLLIWFDALTSFLAFCLGLRILPASSDSSEGAEVHGSSVKTEPLVSKQGWAPFVACTVLIALWNFMYEFFMSGSGGRLKVIHPAHGVQVFGTIMVLNTVICTLLAVKATRMFSRPSRTLPLGSTLVTLGMASLVAWADRIPGLVVSVFLMTLGEVIYGVFTQFLLIRLNPSQSRPSFVYSMAILTANLGRALAAAVVFPLFIYSPRQSVCFAIAGGIWVATILIVSKYGRAFDAATSVLERE